MCCATRRPEEEEEEQEPTNQDQQQQEQSDGALGSWKTYYCCNSIHKVSENDDEHCWWWLFYSWFLLLRDAVCLIIFIVVLMPGFLRFAWYYAITSNRKSVKYGTASCRQTLDVYAVPPSSSETAESQAATATEPQQVTTADSIAEVTSSSCTRSSSNVSSSVAATDDDEEDFVPTTPLLSSHRAAAAAAWATTSAASEEQGLRPVVLFFPGGAWMIGYKMWGTLTARVLTHVFGIVVVVADYQNHIPPYWCSRPATIPDMVDDVAQAIDWTFRSIHEYGGDPRRIWVVGQSAGGHLATAAILRRALERQQQQPSPPTTDAAASTNQVETTTSTTTTTRKEGEGPSSLSWRPCDLSGLISVSAPYNFAAMSQTFRRHGLSHSIVNQMFSTDVDPDDYDPYCLVQQNPQLLMNRNVVLPAVVQIWHGTQDATVPWQLAEAFGQALERRLSNTDDDDGDDDDGRNTRNSRRQEVEFRLYPDWTHTDAILEKPLSGSHEFHLELARTVRGTTDIDYDENHDMLQPMWCPRFTADFARFWIPF